MPEIFVYVRGPYRVLHERDDDDLRPWRVVDSAGTPLHFDASFDGARDWSIAASTP